MKFKVDENLPIEAAALLQGGGPRCLERPRPEPAGRTPLEVENDLRRGREGAYHFRPGLFRPPHASRHARLHPFALEPPGQGSRVENAAKGLAVVAAGNPHRRPLDRGREPGPNPRVIIASLVFGGPSATVTVAPAGVPPTESRSAFIRVIRGQKPGFPESATCNLQLGHSEPPPVAARAHHSPSLRKSAARHKYNAAVVRCGRHLSPKLSR